MKEYKIAKIWAIILCIFALISIALFSLLLLIPFIPDLQNDIKSDGYWGLAVISIIMIASTVLIVLNAIKGKFVIDKNRVYSITAFSYNELLFHEIKGYRKTEKLILIETKSKLKQKIKISTYFGKTNEIIEWLNYNKYPNLDLLEAIDEKKEILTNYEFGSSNKEREQKLTQAYKIAKIMNLAGVVVGIWTLFFPNPYQYSVLISMIFPILYIFILKYFKGLIRIDERKNATYPSISVGLFTPITAITARAFFDFNILDYTNVWLPLLLISIICLTVFLFRNPQVNAEKTIGFLLICTLLICTLCYAYSTCIVLNCAFDFSKPKSFNAFVLNKRINDGETKTYYVNLSAWGSRKESNEITVSKKEYQNIDVKSKITIDVMKGKFDIPWYKIRSKK